jgi:hypothetical protein
MVKNTIDLDVPPAFVETRKFQHPFRDGKVQDIKRKKNVIAVASKAVSQHS